MFWLLFLLGAALNVAITAPGWPAVLAGSLNDPDSYMRLVRLEQGIQAGHLVLTVARDGAGVGTYVEWSRLLDALLWLMAVPLAPFLGWHQALFAAGVALGPLGVGALAAACAWAVEPFAARRFLWSAAAGAAILPGLLTYALPGVVHYHILLLALIVVTAGCVARAWMDESWFGFLGGLAGGFAIWLTPETMPFVLMAFAALLIRAWNAPLGGTLMACAAGFCDVLILGLVFDPPPGGVFDAEIDRLSYVYVVLGLLLLGATALLWQGEKLHWRGRRAGGIALLALAVGGWIALFPRVAMGPYGLMPPEQAKKFFGVMLELRPLHGLEPLIYLFPGFLLLLFALWRVFGPAYRAPELRDVTAIARPKPLGATRWEGRLLWAYVALCLAVALVLGLKFLLFVGFSAAAACALLPVALSEASLRLERLPMAAMLARLGILILFFGVPEVAALPSAKPAAAQKTGPSCGLRGIAPLLAPAAGKIVLAEAQDTPELLYRSRILTVGSLYQHGVPAYLRNRDAWRAPPGGREPAAVQASGAQFILFCPSPGRYAPVADLPKTTLWDALQAGKIPPWLVPAGHDAAGWVLYRIVP